MIIFGWDDAFLLSMNAAGAIFSISQAKSQQQLLSTGRQLEQAAFESNMEAIRAQNSEDSLTAIKSLRENIASQIVTNASRGTASGAGSANVSLQKSEQNFNKDEQTRRMNLLLKENELRANNVLSGLHTLQSETSIGQSLTGQIFNRLPISGLAKKFAPSLGNALDDLGSYVGKKSGFGLNTIGS